MGQKVCVHRASDARPDQEIQGRRLKANWSSELSNLFLYQENICGYVNPTFDEVHSWKRIDTGRLYGQCNPEKINVLGKERCGGAQHSHEPSR